ncbi:hypothetical protein VB796_07930 [Arcicella sp. LKC2W]|uniref:hypothetical protein n=1 Tax=Arcicella sp. LKC2W TaxID=2984198 RepID=UPI002B1FAD77|nr:hypothetical protein [Arcicella sp. LKC2W]MEA5458961.1 hypothetical protein [Arcicella sp. LKC2W]
METNSVNISLKHQTENLSDNNGVENLINNSQEVNLDEIDEIDNGSEAIFDNFRPDLAYALMVEERRKKLLSLSIK